MLTLPQREHVAPEAHQDSVVPVEASVDAAMETPGVDREGKTDAARRDRVGGVAIATCCHHVCNWRDYTGRGFLKRLVCNV